MILDCAGKFLDLSAPCVMGILNITPDSFSDGGRFLSPEIACEHAIQMVKDGAAIIDIGGESTRPGAPEVSVSEEIERVVPIISLLAAELEVPISIDTRKSEVMSEAIQAGAGFINDVSALSAPEAMDIVADSGLPVCLMHMQGEPGNMQKNPVYDDVVVDIIDYFSTRIALCEAAGVRPDNIIVDPGFGFGKTDEHNLQLLGRLGEFKCLNKPVLVGLSRKSMIGRLLGLKVEERLIPSVVLALMAVERGASIVRVHDVKETCKALQLSKLIHNKI